MKFAFLLARSYYLELIASGVKIYEYEPGFTHAKIFVSDDEKAAVAGIEAMENYYQSVGMPTSLCELGIHATEEQIKEMADKCSFYGKRTVGVMKKIGAPEAAEIYRMANDKSIPLYSR